MRVRSLAGGAGLVLAGALLAVVPRAAAQQQVLSVAPRITQAVSDSNLVTVAGTVHPLARAQYDRGAVADSQPIRRALLLLQRSPAQETALRTLLDSQQTRSSLGFHQWLTPTQFGQQFGAADADVQAITAWLTAHGFQVSRVSTGRTVIEFSGTAGQVRDAFHTEIHRYEVNGEQHLANASPVQIPVALAPVVAGVVSLHDFPRKPQSRVRGAFSKSTGNANAKPLFTGSFDGLTYYALGPSDFDKIYTVPSGSTGAGETIAIVGDSEICTASSPDFATLCNSKDDVALFRTAFAVTPAAPSVNVIVDGPDPGINGDETEGDLDVQWSGAVAPNATIDFVTAENTESTAGTDLAAEYVVDNNLAPVISESFGECEAGMGQSGNAFENDLWEQAAAQGITVVVSAGDSGSAGCDDENTESYANTIGAAVNGIASTPFNVAAGGTDFDTTASGYAGMYWNATDSTPGTTGLSAKSYIPEVVWNDSCAQNPLNSPGCSPPSSATYLNIVAGGGGQSNCIIPSFNGAGDFTGCQSSAGVAGYGKPAWQSGPYVSGLASSDAVRNIPDVSLFASDGLISNSFYAVCESDLGATCVSAIRGEFDFLGVGGTSSSSPTFAALMALVNQSTGSRQGNANYVLYPLATKQQQSGANCNSSNGPSNNANSACTFNDVTKGNNSVPCIGESADCTDQSNTDLYGVLDTGNADFDPTGTVAFNTATGYDMATGLGTINVNNLLANWSTVTFTGTTTTLCMAVPPATTCATPPAAIAITHGSPVYVTVNVSPSPGPSSTAKPEVVSLIGTGSFSNSSTAGVNHFTSNNYVISNENAQPLASGAASFMTDFLVGGTYTVQARYAGDGTLGASTSASPGISVTVNPEPSVTTMSAQVLNYMNGTSNNASGENLYYGDAIPLRADVRGDLSGQESATGTVTFTDNGSSIGTFALNAEGYAEDQTGADAVFVSNIAALAVGPHTIQAAYSGDFSYCPSPSVGSCAAGTSLVGSSVSFNVVAAPTTTTVTAGTASIQQASSITVSPGTSVTVQAVVDTENGSSFSSGGSVGSYIVGSVTFSVTPSGGSTAQVPESVVSSSSTFDSEGFVAGQATYTFTPSVTTTITATFTPGNSDYGSSGSSSSAVNVSSTSITLAPQATGGSGDAITVTAGQSGSLPITVASTTFSGNVSLTCSVAPATSMVVNDLPTCSFTLNGAANSTVALSQTANPPVTSGQRMLVVGTTAAEILPTPLRPPLGPNLIVVCTMVALVCFFFLCDGFPRRRLRWATLACVLVIMGTAAVGCGGGSSSSGGQNNSTGGSGTTITSYTVTVIATPAGGAAQQTSVVLNVN